MGIFDIFKKEFWKESKRAADNLTKQGNDEASKPVKTSFVVRYQLVFKDPSDKSFENKPCYKSKFSDGSENDCSLCRKLIDLDRLYSRSDIESISRRLGYSVFDRVGASVDEDGNPNCACKWESSVVIKKDPST
jgi:hypothetical protein